MAMTMQASHAVAISHPANLVEGHHINLRRSTRLHVRRQGTRAICPSASVNNTISHDPTTRSRGRPRKSANPQIRSAVPDSRHATYNTPTATFPSHLVQSLQSKSGGASSSARRQLSSSNSRSSARKSITVPSSRGSKRRCSWDLTDHELVPSSSTLVIDDDARTPRALRAFKRQRLSSAQPTNLDEHEPATSTSHAEAGTHVIDNTPGNGSIKRVNVYFLRNLSTRSTAALATNDQSNSSSLTKEACTLSSTDAGVPEPNDTNHRRIRKSGTRRPASEQADLPATPIELKRVSDLDCIGSEQVPNSVLGEHELSKNNAPLLDVLPSTPPPVPSTLTAANNVSSLESSKAYCPSPSSTDPDPTLVDMHDAPFPSKMETAVGAPATILLCDSSTSDHLFESSFGQTTQASVSHSENLYPIPDGDALDPSSPSSSTSASLFTRLVPPSRQRVRRPESLDTSLWKIVCQERVESLIRHYGKDAVEACVAAEARSCSLPAQFRLYTPDCYASSDGEIFDVEMTEAMSGQDDDDEDDDFDCESEGCSDIDEDFMALEGSPELGFDVMNVDTSPECFRSTVYSPPTPTDDSLPMLVSDASPSRSSSSASSHSSSSFSSLPATPQLPRLSSIRVPGLEPCPVLSPEGKLYMGRGTPVDQQRRADWMHGRSPRYTFGVGPGKDDWAHVLFLPMSINPAPPSKVAVIPEPPYDVSGDIHMFDNMVPSQLHPRNSYDHGNVLTPSFIAPVEPPSIIHYSPTSSDCPWLDPSLRHPCPPETISSMMEGHHLAGAHDHSAMVISSDVPANHTGCQVHSSFLQCLLGTGAGCSNVSLTTSPLTTTSPATSNAVPVDLGIEQVQVPISSTLSHALG